MFRTTFAMLLLLAAMLSQDQAKRSQTNNLPGTPSQSTVERIYTHADGVVAPRAKYSPDPKYPRNGHKPGKQDQVMLSLIVGSDGRPRDIQVARSLTPEFDEAAIDAVKQWQFVPGTKDGKPVAVQINVVVQFTFHQ